MSETAEPIRIEEMLEHAAWLRALARSLVRDSQAADDVVQETWLAAVRNPPRKATGIRAWLRTVARNVVRMEHRSGDARRRRESREPASTGTPPGPHELLERLEMQRRLAALVAELSEPDRTTVLLRFFEGLRPAEIAVRLGVPASTIRGRLARGLARLRERMDDECGGRSTWTAALLPLAALNVVRETSITSTALTIAKGGVVVAGKTKLVVGLAVLVLLSIGLWREFGTPGALDDAGDDERSSAGNTTRSRGADTDDAGRPAPITDAGDPNGADDDSGLPVDPGASKSPVEPDGAKEVGPDGTLSGRVVRRDDGDLTEVRVVVREIIGRDEAKGRSPFEAVILVGVDGAFAVDGLRPGRYRVEAEHATLASSPKVIELREDGGGQRIELVLDVGGSLVVTVLDRGDQPSPDQSVVVRGPCHRQGSTDANGELRLDRLPAGMYTVLRTVASQTIKRVIAVVPLETATLVLRATAILSGTVIGPDGIPPTRAVVRLRPVKYGPQGYEKFEAYIDAKGNYRVRGIPPGTYLVDLQVLKPESYVATTGEVTLEAGEEFEHRIELRTTFVGGRITRADTGSGLKRKQIQIAARKVRVEEGKVVERLASHAMAFATDDGSYEFKGLEPGHWEIWIYPFVRELADVTRLVEVVPGGRIEAFDFELRVRRLGTLRVRILGRDGAGVTGNVSFSNVVRKNDENHYVTLRGAHRGDGRWDFELEEGERRITIHRKGHRSDPDIVAATLVDGEVVEATCRLIQLGTVLVTVSDAAGQPVEGASMYTPGDSAPKRVGAQYVGDGVYKLQRDPGALTLFVRKDDRESAPVRVKVEAGEAVGVNVRLD